MTTAIKPPTHSAIEYPDDDGEPMSDNTLQYKWMVVIKGCLEAFSSTIPNVFVAGNLLWYAVEGEPTIRSAPDAMVAFGGPRGGEARTSNGRKTTSPPRSFLKYFRPAIGPMRWNASLSSMRRTGFWSITSTTPTTERWRHGCGGEIGWKESPIWPDSSVRC